MSTSSQEESFTLPPNKLTAVKEKIDCAKADLRLLFGRIERTVKEAISFLGCTHKEMINVDFDHRSPVELNLSKPRRYLDCHMFRAFYEYHGSEVVRLDGFSLSFEDDDMVIRPLTPEDARLKMVQLINKSIGLHTSVHDLYDAVIDEYYYLCENPEKARSDGNWLVGAFRLYMGTVEQPEESRCSDLKKLSIIKKWESEDIKTRKEFLEMEGLLGQLERIVEAFKVATNETSQFIDLLETKKGSDVKSEMQLKRRRPAVHTASDVE